MKEKYTTAEAMQELGMSRATFFNRVKRLDLQPLNYDSRLLKQKKSLWSAVQVKEIGDFAENQRSAFLAAC